MANATIDGNPPSSPVIVLAGAVGDLGDRIARALVSRGAAVHALVRAATSRTKLNGLSALGAVAVTVDYDDPASLARACGGAACVVSVLNGLKPVILGAQGRLLDGAVVAGGRASSRRTSRWISRRPVRATTATWTCAAPSCSGSTACRSARPRS